MTRVADLAGVELVLWVARAGGASDADIHWRSNRQSFWMEDFSYGFQPHEDWSQGGPLIDQHDIDLRRLAGGGWFAEVWVDHADGSSARGAQAGDTRLVAAMRALVASVYGESVPEEPT